jgi:predicted RNA-binding Zn-ribbon protein involved in translation (DUF1610 family)
MRTHSVYEVVCECGHHLESRDQQFTCPHCGRILDLRWNEQPPGPAPKEGA